jgi:hypothetical protein
MSCGASYRRSLPHTRSLAVYTQTYCVIAFYSTAGVVMSLLSPRRRVAQERWRTRETVRTFTAGAHKLSRSLSACVTDQLHTEWGNLYNRTEQPRCIKLPLASAQVHILRLSLPQA